MNLFAPQHLIPILIIVLLLFGRGKISDLMGDFAKGIKNFKKGLKDDDEVAGKEAPPAVQTLEAYEDDAVATHPVKQEAAASAARQDKR